MTRRHSEGELTTPVTINILGNKVTLALVLFGVHSC